MTRTSWAKHVTRLERSATDAPEALQFAAAEAIRAHKDLPESLQIIGNISSRESRFLWFPTHI